MNKNMMVDKARFERQSRSSTRTNDVVIHGGKGVSGFVLLHLS